MFENFFRRIGLVGVSEIVFVSRFFNFLWLNQLASGVKLGHDVSETRESERKGERGREREKAEETKRNSVFV